MFIFDPRFANFNQWLMILLICTCGESSLVGLECRLEEAILYQTGTEWEELETGVSSSL